MSDDYLRDFLVQAADAALMALVNRLQERNDERWRAVAKAQEALALFQYSDDDE
jgi:hypothetical protein